MKRFYTEFADALYRLVTDRNALMTMVIAIALYSVIYPQPYTDEVVRELPVAIVDQDGSVRSRELARRLDNTDAVRVAAATENLAEAQDLFFAREVYAVVVIPPDFEKDLLLGRHAPVAAYGDGGYFLLYSSFALAVRDATQSIGSDVRVERLTATGLNEERAETIVSPISVQNVPLFNQHGGFATYVIPAAFVLVLQQTLLVGIGLLHSGRSRPSGVRAIATIAAYLALYLVWTGATQVILPAVYGLPRLGSLVDLMVLTVPFLLAVIGMGFALTRIFPSRDAMMFFLILQGVPLFFITGVPWPVEALPETLQRIALVIPSTSAMSAFVRIDQMGATYLQVLPEIMLQIGLAIAYFAAAFLPLPSREKKEALAS